MVTNFFAWAIFPAMTLAQLFIAHGIPTPQELCRRTGIARQYCYALWSGKRRLGARLARTIHDRTGIPLADLITAD